MKPVSMLVLTTTPHIEGKRIVQSLDLVTGTAVRFDLSVRTSPKFREKTVAQALNESLREATQEALQQMGDQARELGANAVVDIRLDTCAAPIDTGVLWVSAIGTAVVFED